MLVPAVYCSWPQPYRQPFQVQFFHIFLLKLQIDINFGSLMTDVKKKTFVVLWWRHVITILRALSQRGGVRTPAPLTLLWPKRSKNPYPTHWGRTYLHSQYTGVLHWGGEEQSKTKRRDEKTEWQPWRKAKRKAKRKVLTKMYRRRILSNIWNGRQMVTTIWPFVRK